MERNRHEDNVASKEELQMTLPLAYRIITQPPVAPAGLEEKEAMAVAEEIRLLKLPSARVIDATNVGDYYWSTEGISKDWSIKDFPNIAPPFDLFFIECHVTDAWIEDYRKKVRQVGWTFQVFSSDEPIPFDACDWNGRSNEVAILQQQEMASQSRWIVRTGMWCSIKDGRPLWFGFSGWLHISEDGKLVGAIATCDTDALREQILSSLRIPLLTISFMHCKNVRQIEVEEDAPRRKWLKRMKCNKIRYSTLNIDPMREVLKSNGSESQGIGLKKALHICRGHFATYSDDKPLFGRVSGTFWKPQHVRGSKEHGEIVKEYEVHAPRAEQ